jgi:hypothetical protein
VYINTNPKSKAQIKRDIKAGKVMRVFQPNNMFGTTPPENGVVTVEGPHYPKPHRWYGQATLKDGVVVAIK